MIHISIALLVMIVRVVMYLVQQNNTAKVEKQFKESKQEFVRHIEHPAEHFIQAQRILSYEKFRYYIRN